jgi:phage tail-like protein
MDIQGSQYHLLSGRADFGRCGDTTPDLGSGRTLADLWDDEPAGLPSSIPTTWEYDDGMRVLRLRRDTPLFRRAGRTDPLAVTQRRGAGRDGYGNWFWIGADQRSIFSQVSGSRAGRIWWSVDDLTARCTCPATSAPGVFAGACTCAPPVAVLRGLCVTGHHYLLAGYRTTDASEQVTEAGLFVFDLQGGGAPLRLLWPDPGGFDPWDLTDTADGGALILDRTHGSYWRLDDHLRLAGTVPATPAGFGPVGGGPPVLQTGPARPTARLLHDDHGNPLHPVCVEPGPDGSVLVLDAEPGRGYSVLYCFDDDVLRWQRPLRDVVEVADENDPDNTPATYSVLAHDIAYAVTGGPLDAPLLYVADGEGEQVIAFTLDPGTGVVTARVEFLPLRRWGARALVRVPGGVWYDFTPTAGDDKSTRWVPLQVFTECRFSATATFTTAENFGDPPGLAGDSFDTRTPGCAWHRLILDAHIPAGTAITIRARAADDPALLLLEPWLAQPVPYRRSDGSELPWNDPWADVRGDPRDPRPLPDGMGTHELLFQGVLGRYLQLEVTFVGGGHATPLLRSLRAWYPRFSYVDHYLPAVYGENDAPGRFLERFLANFEGLYTALEEKIEHTHMILDPRTARAADLPWLASWFSLVLDPLWDEPRRRFLIRHLDRFYRMRGTVRGLVATLRVYLDPIVDEGVFCAGADAGAVRVVERFLTRDTGGALYGAPLSMPDPDPFARALASASRFDVLVPAGLSADNQAMVRRIVENAKPAHTAFVLRPYYELFVVGQARLGIDTEIGQAPVFVPAILGNPDALLAAGYLGYPRPFDLADRVVSDRDRVGSLPAL